jgi:hypothetical protein
VFKRGATSFPLIKNSIISCSNVASMKGTMKGTTYIPHSQVSCLIHAWWISGNFILVVLQYWRHFSFVTVPPYLHWTPQTDPNLHLLATLGQHQHSNLRVVHYIIERFVVNATHNVLIVVILDPHLHSFEYKVVLLAVRVCRYYEPFFVSNRLTLDELKHIYWYSE